MGAAVTKEVHRLGAPQVRVAELEAPPPCAESRVESSSMRSRCSNGVPAIAATARRRRYIAWRLMAGGGGTPPLPGWGAVAGEQ